jgi:hypothetical protein
MAAPLIAVVGDVNPARPFDPPMTDATRAKAAAEAIGAELAKRGARLLVYGGPYLEADVVRGFVAANPSRDRSIEMCYSSNYVPPPFDEEQTRPTLFVRRIERGADWEVAFYRSITRADGMLLIGGGSATQNSGQIAIGTRMPLLSLAEFGGAAKRVWDTLSAGEDLPTRDQIDLMARPWSDGSAVACVDALFQQRDRRRAGPERSPVLSIIAALLFLGALAIIPWTWGQNNFEAWMLFLAPLLAGGGGAAIRPAIDRLRGSNGLAIAAVSTVVIGLVAGGVAGILFVTAQLTGNPHLIDAESISAYCRHAIPYAVGVGFIAGLTSDAVFSKLLGLDVVDASGIESARRA